MNIPGTRYEGPLERKTNKVKTVLLIYWKLPMIILGNFINRNFQALKWLLIRV